MNIIKYLREKNNYSQAQIADVLGISRQAYIKYETGEVEPPVSTVRKLSRIYSVSYKDLIDDVVPEEKESVYKIHETSSYAAEPSYGFAKNSFHPLYKTENSSLISQITYIKMLLSGLESQLRNQCKGSDRKPSSELKKRLNVKTFISSTKPVNIDGSFIEEMRSQSMERNFNR